MSERYYQLTQEQRYKLEAYLESGKNQTQIAGLLGVHKSTISRELCRNVPCMSSNQSGLFVKECFKLIQS